MQLYDVAPGNIKDTFPDSRSAIVKKMTRFVKIFVVFALQANLMGGCGAVGVVCFNEESRALQRIRFA